MVSYFIPKNQNCKIKAKLNQRIIIIEFKIFMSKYNKFIVKLKLKKNILISLIKNYNEIIYYCIYYKNIILFIVNINIKIYIII